MMGVCCAGVGSPASSHCSWSIRQRIRTVLGEHVLPHRALNEVYIAEMDPSRWVGGVEQG